MLIIGAFFLLLCAILGIDCHIIFIIFYLLINYFLLKKYSKQLLILLNLLIICFSLTINPKIVTLPEIIEGKVVLTKENYYVLKTDYGKIRVVCNEVKVKNGNYIKIKTLPSEFSEMDNFNSFNAKIYYKSQKIFYQVKEVEIINNNNHLNLLGLMIDKIERLKDPKIIAYTKQLLLGITNEDMEEVQSISQKLSILHLFALSGMHLSILKKILIKIRIKDERIILFILGIYTLMLSHLVSILRAYLMMLFKYLFKERFNQLELLCLIGILLLLYNPFTVYSLSFVFSFTIYGFMILTQHLKHASIYPFISSIPIILSTQYSLSLFTIFYVWLFSPIVEILYSLILLNFVTFNIFKNILIFILNQFERVLFLLDLSHIELIFKKPSLLFIVFYYLLLLIIIYHEQIKLSSLKYKFGLCIILVILYFNPYYTIFSEVTMINVGQGDSILIRLPFNKGNYLIDTGGNEDYDIATKTIIPYLKSIGIKSLDALIISHDDFDHSGASESLIQNFKVKQIIENKQDIAKLKCLDINVESSEKNDSSLVYYLKLNGYGYLFTGDLSAKGEKEIIKKYPDLQVDVLKIGHHGSLTSTSNELLSVYKPKIGLIGVGKYNFYGHPHPKIIERLEAYHTKIYRTDLNGMIRIRSFLKYHTIRVVDNSN